MLSIYKNRGQSSLEYTIIIIILIGALLAISTYFKRGIQGRWKDSVDGLGDQYDPLYTKSEVIQNMSSLTETRVWGSVIINSINPQQIHTFRTDNINSTETTAGESTVSYYF